MKSIKLTLFKREVFLLEIEQPEQQWVIELDDEEEEVDEDQPGGPETLRWGERPIVWHTEGLEGL